MANKLLIDSSYLIAIYYAGDTNHSQAAAFERKNKQPRLIPNLVLPEVWHMLKHYLGQEAAEQFVGSVLASAAELEMVSRDDLQRAYEIMQAYPKARLDLVDCCLFAVAERLNITQICTFDRRDFSIFRPRHCPYLELLP